MKLISDFIYIVYDFTDCVWHQNEEFTSRSPPSNPVCGQSPHSLAPLTSKA